VAQRTVDTQSALARADEGISESGERITSLAQRAGEIDRIIALINELADRTNLLALNAAIEAARAGEAGAGFAVVAEEVRLLAERSKSEAAKITEIVQRSQQDTATAVRAMERGSTDMHHGRDADGGGRRLHERGPADHGPAARRHGPGRSRRCCPCRPPPSRRRPPRSRSRPPRAPSPSSRRGCGTRPRPS
jgi:hypothetical protein